LKQIPRETHCATSSKLISSNSGNIGNTEGMAAARRMTDHEVVEAFVAFLADHSAPGLRVDRRPDKEKAGDIDAIAGRFAIEHTSIDTLPEQRRQSAYLAQLIDDLEATVVTQQPMQVLLHYDAVQTGQDWPAIRRALKHWLESEAQRLPEKLSRGQIVPGVPFTVDVLKRDFWKWPRRIYVGRYVPEDATLAARLKELCDRKVEKLSRWASPSTTTVLLLENDDIALMNEIKLVDAVLAAYPDGRPASVDEFWYVSTAGQPQLLLFHDLTAIWDLPENERYPEIMFWPSQQ
jgi:hypothetical protein